MTVKNSTLAELISITPQEVDRLGLEKLRQDHAYKYREPVGLATEKKKRRVAIRKIVDDNGGRVPTVTQLRKALQNRGFNPSRGTVHNDLKALDLRTENAKRRDAARQAEAAQGRIS